MKELEINIPFDIPEDTLARWQNIVDLMAELVGIPAALIMPLDQVLKSSFQARVTETLINPKIGNIILTFQTTPNPIKHRSY